MKQGVTYISSHFVLESVGSFSSEKEYIAVMIQLRFIHAILVHELSYPICTHHCDDDAKQEVDASGPLHNNDNLQKTIASVCSNAKPVAARGFAGNTFLSWGCVFPERVVHLVDSCLVLGA